MFPVYFLLDKRAQCALCTSRILPKRFYLFIFFPTLTFSFSRFEDFVFRFFTNLWNFIKLFILTIFFHIDDFTFSRCRCFPNVYAKFRKCLNNLFRLINSMHTFHQNTAAKRPVTFRRQLNNIDRSIILYWIFNVTGIPLKYFRGQQNDITKVFFLSLSAH